MKYFMFQRK